MARPWWLAGALAATLHAPAGDEAAWRLRAMANGFDFALAKLIEVEGGYSNDPRDRGGETYAGVTRQNWDGWLARRFGGEYEWPPTDEQVAVLYREAYWERHGYGEMPPPVAVEMLKMAVHRNHGQAVRILQRALRAALRERLADDGAMGPRTWDALQRADPATVAAAMRSEAARYYDSIVRANPANEPFRNGWLNRAYA